MNPTTIFAGINVALIIGLLVLYGRIFAKTRSLFTFGLLLFAALFLLQNATILYFALTMMPLYEPGVESFMLSFAVLQTVAFAILNWITWK
jgi:hypothetical protein